MRLALALSLALCLSAACAAAQTCTTQAVTAPRVVNNPGISAAELSSSGISTPPQLKGCSETIDLGNTSQPSSPPGGPAWPRTSCPHLRTDLTPWEAKFPIGSITAGQDVDMTTGMKLLLRPCSLAGDASLNPGTLIRRIMIRSGAVLVLDDQDIKLHVREIYIEDGGEMWIGSETCRLYSSIDIMFHGTKTGIITSNGDPATGVTKGLQCRGRLEMHGKEFMPTWTRLARTAAVGSTVVFLQDAVNWEVGQKVLFTTTAYYDCPAQWQSYCGTSRVHQNEVRTIAAIEMNYTSNEWAIKIDSALSYEHYAGVEYQGEVALLSRKIHLWGEATADDTGMHQLVAGSNALGRWQGVQVENGGQLNIEARYPFHLHLLSQTNGQQSYIKDCSVTNSNFRCYVVHQVSGTTLHSNVAYNANGMCFYLEDGIEEENELHFNLAAHIHPIFKPANGGYGQGGESFDASSSLIVPADTSASGFYIPNAYNSYLGNAASGGWSGFAFPNTPRPIGLARGQNLDTLNPERRPTLLFRGNSAHSAGFYWDGHGSCFYTGAQHTFDSTKNLMHYDSGRFSRSTVDASGKTVWMQFEDTKAFLCKKAVAHWGNQLELIRFELHDSESNGAMVFGEAALFDGLINARSGNTVGVGQIGNGLWGFQFYDTWVKIILSRVTFRGFKALTGDTAIRFMDHSDQFLPQGINSVKGLKFEDCDASTFVAIKQCGPDCGGDELSATMSSKIYSIWDWDGSLVGAHPSAVAKLGTPQILGSNRQWWEIDPATCDKNPDWKMWHCDWSANRQIVYAKFKIPGVMEGCNTAFGSCNGQKAGYTVGEISLWGKSSTHFITMSPWPGVTGIGNTGWHWRPVTSTNVPAALTFDGAPQNVMIDDFQMSRGNFVVLSMRYPADTTFSVELSGWGIAPGTPVPLKSKQEVLSNVENIGDTSTFNCSGSSWNELCSSFGGGVGPAWHWDGLHLFVRLVRVRCYTQAYYSSCADYYYSYDGAKIWSIDNAIGYKIVASSAAGTTVGSGATFYDVPDQNSPAAFASFSGSTSQVTNFQYRTVRPCNGAPSLTTVSTSTSSSAGGTSSSSGTTGTTGVPSCVPLSTCPNATCGDYPDGCGGVIFCGTAEAVCPGSYDVCNVNNECICQPRTCEELGYACGLGADDCLKGDLLDCGLCVNENFTCTSEKQCLPNGCTPTESCLTLGHTCGQMQTTCQGTAEDISFSCGVCQGAQETCDMTGTVHSCKCTPKTFAQACTAEGRFCGFALDGCGSAINCGSCSPNESCLPSSGCTSLSCGINQVLQSGACKCAEGFELDEAGFCASVAEVDGGIIATRASVLLITLLTAVALFP